MIRIKSFAGVTDKGRVRSSNEDSLFMDGKDGVFIVADGMGGHSSGEVASRIVVDALPQLVGSWTSKLSSFKGDEALNRVKAAIVELSEQIVNETSERPALYGMGSTVVMALFRGAGTVIAHMGDSRAYLFRSKKLVRMTTDHSLVQLLLDSGEISEEQIKKHPAKSQITRHVGMRGEALPDAKFLEMVNGDRLLLCSDGLTGLVEDDEIRKILSGARGPSEACGALVKAANSAGGSDNITVIVVDVWDDEASSTETKYKTRVIKIKRI
ncbi:MAG: Stp1/IreP family PP2C-type Ser/Thr phosphatase [Nitrospinae bacterium]|nr:Stp1/IreP family PP2C-type Ser/Thr phosphatase [Nitrospinota bacterium]